MFYLEFMHLIAQRVSLGASTPVSVSSDIPLFNGEWRLSLKSISLQRGFGGGDSLKCTQLHNSHLFYTEDVGEVILFRQHSWSK